MLKISFIFIVFGIVGFGLNQRNTPSSAKRLHPFDLSHYGQGKSSFPLSINCPQSDIGYLRFKGKVISHSDFFRYQSFLKEPRKLVKSQLKYIDGFLDHIDHSHIRFVPHWEKKFKVLKIKRIRYPIDIFLDKIEVNPSYYPPKSLDRLYAKGRDAIEVHYQANIKVTRCVNAQESVMTEYKLTLPLDPYLAYWYVPKKHWVEMTYHPKVKMLTTPCASKTMAQLRHPNMYWNVWKPMAKNCSDFLKENRHVKTLNATFKKQNLTRQKINFSHLKDKPKIEIAVISGLLYSIPTDENLHKVRNLLKDINSIDKIGKERLKGQDVGTIASAPRGAWYIGGESPHEKAPPSASRSKSWAHGGNDVS